MPETAPPPFLRLGGDAVTPLVIAVPHAGRHYPAEIEAARAVPRATLEQIEDRHADRLIGPLVARGAVAIVATHARAWIDLNRGEEDIDSARGRGGLGLVPSRLAGRALWRTPPSRAEVEARLAAIHMPYHAAVATALAAARRRHGHALLIDCHSMPPLGRRGSARIVLGDRYGASADPAIAAAAAEAAERRGFAVARNAPYAGAFTLAHHGRPALNVQALQIEVDRSLYLDAALREPAEALPAIADLVTAMAWAALLAASPPAAMAAE